MIPSPFLTTVIELCLAGLLFAGALCLYRMIIGPKAVDRAVATDALSSIFTAMLCLLCLEWGSVVYFDAVWILMLLGFLGSASIAKYLVYGKIF